jgi:hypothetical protein
VKRTVSRFQVVSLREVLGKTARNAKKINQTALIGQRDEELVASRGFDELSERVFHPGRHNRKQDGKQ